MFFGNQTSSMNDEYTFMQKAPKVDANGNLVTTEADLAQWIPAVVRLYQAGKVTIPGMPPASQSPVQSLLGQNGGMATFFDKFASMQQQMMEIRMSMQLNQMLINAMQNMFSGMGGLGSGFGAPDNLLGQGGPGLNY